MRTLSTQRPTRRGYALVIVLLVLALIAVAVGVVMNALQASSASTGAALKARQTFYACDGMVRSLTRLAGEHLASGEASSEALANAICTAAGGGCVWNVGTSQVDLAGVDPIPRVRPNGYRVTEVVVSSLAATGCLVDADCGPGSVCAQAGAGKVCRRAAPLPDGPFEGMQALADTIRIGVEAEWIAGGNVCRAAQDVTVGSVAMTQFYVFSALPYTDWQPSGATLARGRLHANGALCLGGPAPGGERLYLRRLTSAGDVNPMSGTLCRNEAAFGRDDVFIGETPGADFDANDDGDPSDLVAADFSELLTSDRSATWVDDALAKWGGQLKDVAHGVAPLRLAVLSAPTAQQGRGADGVLVANTATMRFLVDPILAADDVSVRAEKLALKADLRIINGVWYLRDVNNPAAPGIPIWSDHPGNLTTTAHEGVEIAGLDVGQQDLFGGGARPERFSYYPATTAEVLDYDAPAQRAVVSYGALYRDGTGTWPVWRPGFRCSDGSVHDATELVPAVCPGGWTPPSVEHALLHGTRSGFRDAHQEHGAAGGAFTAATSTPANILPLNFDVGELQVALADNAATELGGLLLAAGRTFNGIVYIAATWAGSMQSPPLANDQGNNDLNSEQVELPTASTQQQLPFPLCGDSAVAPDYVPGGAFKVPDCAGYRDAGPTRRAQFNAVRVINARNIDVNGSTDPGYANTANHPAVPGGELPAGLTIATHLPLYLLGDVNASSNVRELNPADVDYRWRPVLFAGDTINVLSNGWDDAASRWHESADCPTGGVPFDCTGIVPTWPRAASRTRIHAALLGGMPMTTPNALNNAGANYSGGVERFVRTQEEWVAGGPLHVAGALLVTHLPVYARYPTRVVSGVTTVPTRVWDFDPHFEGAFNLPPGVPLFDVSAIRQWTRK